MDGKDLDDLMASIIKAGPKESRPGAWHSPDGDCIFCFVEDVDDYGEYVNKWLTVYRAEEDDRVTGVQINYISRLTTASAKSSLPSRPALIDK